MATNRWEARAIGGAELGAVAEVLARAFTDDPVWKWVLPRSDADDRRGRLERFFVAVLGRIYVRTGLIFTAGELAGAAAWAPPGGWHIGLVDEARLAAPILAAFGTAVVRLLRLQAATNRAHLKEPHYYLFLLGADPPLQGQGVGAALLRPMLARCDAEKMPAYLESSNPKNLPFYRRHGFEVTGELRFDDAVLSTMRRAPRG